MGMLFRWLQVYIEDSLRIIIYQGKGVEGNLFLLFYFCNNFVYKLYLLYRQELVEIHIHIGNVHRSYYNRRRSKICNKCTKSFIIDCTYKSYFFQAPYINLPSLGSLTTLTLLLYQGIKLRCSI